MKPKRNERLLKKGHAKLEREIDIVEFLKQFRAIKAGMRELLGSKDLVRVINTACIREVDSGDEEESDEQSFKAFGSN